jgi:phosphoglycolate phosphatase
MPFDALLYDHDGTLVNSLPVVIAATNSVLKNNGYALDAPNNIVSAMVLATAPRMGFHAHVSDPAIQKRLADEFYCLARELGPKVSSVYAGIPELITAVKERGLKQGVISNNQGDVVRLILRHHGLADAFTLMYGEDDMPAPKPSPSGLLQAAAALGLSCEKCIFVGDSENDSQAARAAGMTSIGVTWGIHNKSTIMELGFDYVVDKPEEILRVVGIDVR